MYIGKLWMNKNYYLQTSLIFELASCFGGGGGGGGGGGVVLRLNTGNCISHN